MQHSRILSLAIGAALLSAYGAAQAAPFSSFDPRSMAMGGAGVAVGNAATAPFFNPALLAATSDDDDFALELPIVGGRLYDPDGFIDAAQDFADSDVADELDAAIAAYNANPDLLNTTNVRANVDVLETELLKLVDKPLHGELGAAVVVGIPSKKFGMAFTASGTASAGGVINYRDEETMAKLDSDLTKLEACYATADPDACIQTTRFNFVSNIVPGLPLMTFSTTGENSDVRTTVDVRGLALMELGISIASEFEIAGQPYAFGVTPKYVIAKVFDYEANPDTVKGMDEDDYMYEYAHYNMDIGVARDFFDGWRAGLVVKNVVPQSYDTYRRDPATDKMKKTGNSIDTAPQARFGVSHQAELYTLAADVDLTENDAVGYEGSSRYVSLGAEFNAWNWAQLRVGYRANTVDSDRNVWSAGFGLSPFGVHIDAAVSGNESEIGAALQLGFRF